MNRRVLVRSALAFPLGVGIGWYAKGRASLPALYEGPFPPGPLADTPSSEPRLALVLGSGGPRGFAHVGVLRALEAQGIKPDLVVGTSMGALVGALWASGLAAQQVQQLLWNAQPSRWWRDLRWHRYGWLSGDSLQQDLNAQVAQRRIEQFPIRFIAVATRLPTGERTEFASGDAGAAVRASSSIVGLFMPVQIGEHAYGDGDLVAPVPVATAKRLGAKTIIAVDVSADLRDTPTWEHSTAEWVRTGILRKQLIDREMALADIPVHVRTTYYTGSSANYKNYAADMGEQITIDALRAHNITRG